MVPARVEAESMSFDCQRETRRGFKPGLGQGFLQTHFLLLFKCIYMPNATKFVHDLLKELSFPWILSSFLSKSLRGKSIQFVI